MITYKEGDKYFICEFSFNILCKINYKFILFKNILVDLSLINTVKIKLIIILEREISYSNSMSNF